MVDGMHQRFTLCCLVLGFESEFVLEFGSEFVLYSYGLRLPNQRQHSYTSPMPAATSSCSTR